VAAGSSRSIASLVHMKMERSRWSSIAHLNLATANARELVERSTSAN